MTHKTMHDHEMLMLQRERVRIFKSQGSWRPWHMWGIGCLLGLAILAGAGEIAASLESYCPEPEGIEFVLT